MKDYLKGKDEHIKSIKEEHNKCPECGSTCLNYRGLHINKPLYTEAVCSCGHIWRIV
jgi:DNA-directed RNA polymerase subunit M/transcription elongation factor TFIIS